MQKVFTHRVIFSFGLRRETIRAGMAIPDPEFFQSGLRFSCTACGHCCVNHHAYDFVYLTAQDLRAVASWLGLSPPTFRRRYTKKAGRYVALKDIGDRCVFLEPGGGCRESGVIDM